MRLAAWMCALLVGCSSPPSDGLSDQVGAAAAPVLSAIAAEQDRQAAAPAAADDIERLLRLGRLDQVGRQAWRATDMSALTPQERAQAEAVISSAIADVDARNIAALLEMLPTDGWFTPDLYGEAGSQAALLIVQHAAPDHQRRVLPVLEPLAAEGRIDPAQYALMYDRVQTGVGAPQRYGSQLTCREGRWTLLPVEDPDELDRRRAAMGLEPITDYLARFERDGVCG